MNPNRKVWDFVWLVLSFILVLIRMLKDSAFEGHVSSGKRMKFERRAKEICTPFLFFVIGIAAFGGFLFGYHTGIISGALIFLTPAFQLSIAEQAMVVSFILVGAIVGALIAGILADQIGRKRTLAVTAALFIFGGAIIALSGSYATLLLGRGISGLGIGIVSLAAPLYLAEVSPPHFRGTFVSTYQFAIAIGILVSFVVNYVFAVSANWRWMFAMGIFPALFQMFALFFIPETPAWLFKRGLVEHALLTLQRLRRDKEWVNHLDAMKNAAMERKKLDALKTLCSSKMRFVLVIGGLLSAFQQITGINTVIYYAPKIFQTAGFASATGAIFATLSIGIINVISTLFSVWLLDKVGRRRLLLIGVTGMGLSLGFLAMAFFIQTAFIGKIAILSLMAYVAFFAMGLGPVTWVIISEIYPMKVRGKAMTVATVINWMGNYFVSLTFLDLIRFIGIEGTFFLYALMSAITFWFIFCYIPETKGKSLEEIETLLIRN